MIMSKKSIRCVKCSYYEFGLTWSNWSISRYGYRVEFTCVRTFSIETVEVEDSNRRRKRKRRRQARRCWKTPKRGARARAYVRGFCITIFFSLRVDKDNRSSFWLQLTYRAIRHNRKMLAHPFLRTWKNIHAHTIATIASAHPHPLLLLFFFLCRATSTTSDNIRTNYVVFD